MAELNPAARSNRHVSMVLCYSFVIVALAAVAAGCAHSSSPPTALGGRNGSRPFWVVKPAATGAFWGGQIAPTTSPVPYSTQEALTEQLETNDVNRRLAIHHEFRLWSELANLVGPTGSPDPEFSGDIAFGRVPLIAMYCGDDMTQFNGQTKFNLPQIANGDADADLAKVKAGLSTLTYQNGGAYPIMLRYFWEFNLNAADINNPSINHNDHCFVPKGSIVHHPSPAPDTTAPPLNTQFIEAWQHVHNALQPNAQNIPNIAFVWNPSVWDKGIPWQQGIVLPPVDPTTYYPGTTYVDWIAGDGYSTMPSPAASNTPFPFDAVFHNFVSSAASIDSTKPIGIGETASCHAYKGLNLHPDQEEYIAGARDALKSTFYVNNNVRAFMYFDAEGQYVFDFNGQQQVCDWSLARSSPEMSAFAAMGADSYFLPTPAP